MEPTIQPQAPIKDHHNKPLFFVALVLGLTIIGFAAWYGIDQEKQAQNLETEFELMNQTPVSSTADWKTYRNEELGVEFSYPDSYIVIDKNIASPGEKRYPIVITTGATSKMSILCAPPECEEFKVNNHDFKVAWTTGGLESFTNVVLPLTAKEDIYFVILEKEKNHREIVLGLLSTFRFISNSTITSDSRNVDEFIGFYIKRKVDYGELGSGVCDAFEIQNSNPLVRYYKKWVEDGNTVNELSKNGNLIINLDLENLSPAQKNTTISSNANKLITLKLRKKVQEGRGAPLCYSFFDIVEIK